MFGQRAAVVLQNRRERRFDKGCVGFAAASFCWRAHRNNGDLSVFQGAAVVSGKVQFSRVHRLGHALLKARLKDGALTRV